MWWLLDSRRLSSKARELIQDADIAYLSAISAWEIEIKKARGNLEAPDNLEATIASRGVRPLSVTLAHAVAAGRLPLLHRDPFDRMLVAQAKVESLILLTTDTLLRRYDARVMIV